MISRTLDSLITIMDEEHSPEGSIRTTIYDVDVQFRMASARDDRSISDMAEGSAAEIFEDMFTEIHDDDVFFEIGAYIGMFSCVIGQKSPGIGIVCFEPHPHTREILTRNLQLNGIDATVMDCAISNSDGTIAFDDRSDTPEGMGEVRHTEGKMKTPARTLDGVVADGDVPSPTVIMSDIVGEETNMLRGGSRTLSSPTMRVAYIVIHDQPLERLGSSKQELEELLRRYGFDELEYLRDNLLKAKKSSQTR
ncbi:FkbM family methyltransferase [Halococcus sediminicola]|uniref:FkbM family methyltransferase n=1 Tax=Halococcus sediminicola TaxID=1264579 RepID=UPI001377DBE5|nr:FkbM family methyltransferase [Halococcus sediminicola]